MHRGAMMEIMVGGAGCHLGFPGTPSEAMFLAMSMPCSQRECQCQASAVASIHLFLVLSFLTIGFPPRAGPSPLSGCAIFLCCAGMTDWSGTPCDQYAYDEDACIELLGQLLQQMMNTDYGSGSSGANNPGYESSDQSGDTSSGGCLGRAWGRRLRGRLLWLAASTHRT